MVLLGLEPAAPVLRPRIKNAVANDLANLEARLEMVVPALLLTSLMSTSVGFGTAQGVENPMVITFITNMIIFFVELLSPIVVPIDQFPDWLVSVQTGR